MDRFYIALGSNVGDRRAALEAGLRGLAGAGVELGGVSGVYETEPVGCPEGAPWFLNLVAWGRLDAAAPGPRAILAAAKETERRAGRGAAPRNAPRVLDIDLLLYGDLVSSDPSLTVPHPRFHRRRFVLEPLADLAPDLTHPVLGRTVQALLAEVEDSAEVRLLDGPAPRPGGGNDSLASSCGPGGPVL